MSRNNVGDCNVPQSVDGENGSVNALQFVIPSSSENAFAHRFRIVYVNSDTESTRIRTPLNGGKDVGLFVFRDKKRETNGSSPSPKKVRNVEQAT